MALFMIRRRMPGATESELDAAMFRSLVCTKAFPEMRWVRSFWNAEREESTCLYEAASVDEVQRFSQMAHIPCDEVWQVNEVYPGSYWGTPEGEWGVQGAPASVPA